LREVLAKITLDSKSRQIRDLSLLQKRFRFKCKRCGTFCCRLGGPELTGKDIERIEKAGCHVKDFLEPANSKFRGTPLMSGSLKNREDGACIFLVFDAKQNRYECSIYDFRPILCRLYPFDFQRISTDSIVLKLIPCCRGLNNPDGKLVDERFINKHLLAPLLERLETEW
jgi:Fe-S-cluster containining protein